MEEYLKARPKKEIFSKNKIESLRKKAIEEIKIRFLPNEKIIKIILVGSSIKNSFGKYELPGFRGSLFSDFDFIFFVEEDYAIPKWLNKEPDGKPFPDDSMNLAYRNKKLIEEKYDLEIFFIRKSNMQKPQIQELGEEAGIPMNSNSKHKYIIIYSKELK